MVIGPVRNPLTQDVDIKLALFEQKDKKNPGRLRAENTLSICFYVVYCAACHPALILTQSRVLIRLFTPTQDHVSQLILWMSATPEGGETCEKTNE